MALWRYAHLFFPQIKICSFTAQHSTVFNTNYFHISISSGLFETWCACIISDGVHGMFFMYISARSAVLWLVIAKPCEHFYGYEFETWFV